MTIQGLPVPVSSAQTFTGPLAVVPGTTVFTITATDGSGNTATARYEVDVSDAPKTFTYDANGNLTADGTRSFEWDARNQLVAVTVGTRRSEFVYDGLRRRVSMVEKENGVVQSHLRAVWCEMTICENRAADGVAVTRRAFGLGEQVNGQARYFTTDHLGSVREVTDTAGTLLARYAFDPWGRRTVTAGADVTTVGFTGHRTHTTSGLALTLYRGYDAGLGRWVSEDPIGVLDGPNRYQYAHARPLSSLDRFGLWAAGVGGGVGGALAAFGVGLSGHFNCSIVVDGKGNIGVLCCGGAGWAGGIGLMGGKQAAGLVCPDCDTICDLAGWYGQVEVQVATAGAGPSASGSASRGSRGTTVGASFGGRAGVGVVISGGGGRCTLRPLNTECDRCGP